MNNLGQYLPLAVPDTTTFSQANGFDLDADYYVIALVQHREQMHSDLPPTLLREYVQLETPANASWSKHVALQNDLLDGTSVPTLMPDGLRRRSRWTTPTSWGRSSWPRRTGRSASCSTTCCRPAATATCSCPRTPRIMGSGMGPMPDAMMDPMDRGHRHGRGAQPGVQRGPEACADCFKDNRATLHLHGGITPWISDGTPHQWITPANENTPWPEGVSVGNVPDMTVKRRPACPTARRQTTAA